MGHLHMRINELLKEHSISKNTICKELDLPRANLTDIVTTTFSV